MSITFSTTQSNANSLNYEKYLLDRPVKTERYKDPTLLDFSLAPIDNSFVKLKRGAYIKITSSTYPVWFSGFVTNEPELSYLGSKNHQAVWGYKYQATSDEYALNLKPIGIIEPFMNVTMGQILKALVTRITNASIISNIAATFDVSGIQDGPLVAQYTIEPDKKFLDVVHDLCESASFVFRTLDKKLYFEAQDQVSGTVVLDGTNKHFTPARLTIKPSTTPVINDVTVIGDPEPAAYVSEYFVGTGLDSTFPLISSVFGADSSVLLDESFGGSSINGSLWRVYDPPQTYLRVDSGYLNVLGGTGSFTDVRMESANAIPLEGRLRITHGEWDFISGNGLIGGLWSAAPNAGLVGCVYGLKVQGTALSPVVNGTTDSQSVTLDTTKRYVLRTIVEFPKTNRQEQTYTYVDASGARKELGGSSDSDTALWSTVVTEVDPTTGEITNQFWFRNTSVVADSYAVYCPVVSSTLHATVTNITISVPVAATLELAHNLPILNGNFDTWTSDTAPKDWTNAVNAYKEDTYSNSGSALKLDPGDLHEAYVAQNVDGLIEAGKAYTVIVRLRKTNSTASGTVRIYLKKEDGTTLDAGLSVAHSAIPNADYGTFTGALCGRMSEVPANLSLVVQIDEPTVSGRDAFFIDDLVILSEYRQEMVGPNDVDAVDGLAPAATIVAGNTGSDTKSSMFASGQYNAGQSQLVFFKDSVTRTSNTPPENQVIRLSYRSAGSAIGRSRNRNSVLSESANWGDSGIRSVVRTDISPRPRNSRECEMAAAALVMENSFDHYEGTYEQYSMYFDSEPRPGYLIKFQNIPDVVSSAEEIQEVRTTLEAKHPEVFNHTISFGKADVARRVASKFDSVKGLFQKTSSKTPTAVESEVADDTAIYAPDVSKPYLLWWDSRFVYLDAGQELGTDGLYFEVRYTDSGWGVDDGKNLVTRSTSRLISVPRNDRGRVVFIRQVNAGNHIQWSEDFTKSNYTGSTVTRESGLDEFGNYTQLNRLSLSSSPFSISFGSSQSGPLCFSASIKGPAGKTAVFQVGTVTKSVSLTGYWQRISVSVPSGSASSATVTCSEAIYVFMTKASLETGTLAERSYSRTTSDLYGPMSRYPAVIHASFPAAAPVDDPTTIGLAADADVVTNITGEYKYEDAIDGKSYTLTLSGAYTPPDPIGTFSGVQLYYENAEQSGKDTVPLDGTGKIDGTQGVGGDWRYTKGPKINHKDGKWTIAGLDPVDLQTKMRVYFCSFNTDGKENPLVQYGKEGATPSVLITVDPATEQFGPALRYAPLAKNLVVTSGPTITKDDGAIQHWTVDLQWENPTTDTRFPQLKGYQIIKLDDDGKQTIEATVTKTDTARTMGPFIVKPGNHGYSFRLLSFSEEGVNSYASGLTPQVGVTVTPDIGEAGQEYTSLVTNLVVGTPTYESNGRGQKTLRIPVSWTIPDDSTYGGCTLYFHVDGREYPATGGLLGSSTELVLQNFPSETVTWALYALSFNKKNEPNTYVSGTTPETSFQVPPPPLGALGLEYAPLGTGFGLTNTGGFTAGVKYELQDGGDYIYSVSALWDEPDLMEDPELGGYDIDIVYEDGRVVESAANISATYSSKWVSQTWPLLSDGGTFTLYLVSWDVSGRRNKRVAGVTPSVVVTVARPVGATGAEYAPNVSLFDVGTITYDVDASGAFTSARVPVSCVLPTSARFGGYVVYLTSPRFTTPVPLTGVLNEPTTVITLPFVPDPAENWTFFAVSYSTNNKPNSFDVASLVSGTYETVAVGPQAIGDPGTEYVPVVTGLGVTIEYRTLTDGGVSWTEWRLFVQFTPPTDKRYGGAKIVLLKTSPALEYQPGEYTGPAEGTFKTQWRSLKTGEVYTCYVDSCDVNNRENNIVSSVTPKVTNIAPVTQTTNTINGANLAPLSIPVAAFASTLVPPEVVSALPTSGLGTTYTEGRLVVLTTDYKLYRLTKTGPTSYAWSKAVDGTDIVNANAIVAGTVVAGGIATAQLAGQEIIIRNNLTGSAVSASPRFKVQRRTLGTGGTNVDTDVAFIGTATVTTIDDFTGIWTSRLKVSTAINSSGAIDINGASASISITGGANTTTIDTVNGFRVVYNSGTKTVQVSGGQFGVYSGVSGSGLDENGLLISDATNVTSFGKTSMQLGSSSIFSMNYGSSAALYGTTATAGTLGAPPAAVAGYIIFTANGNIFKIPFYKN